MQPPCKRPRDTPCVPGARDTEPQAAWLKPSSIAWKVRGAIVARVPPRGERCGPGPGPHRRAPRGQVPRSRTPSEAAIALAMAMGAVWGGLGVAGRLRQGIKVNGLRGPQRLQDGLEPLPRPRQQAAEPLDGDPGRRRTPAVGGGLELLLEDLRGQEPCPRLWLVEPAVQGSAHGRVARGWTTSLGRLPISQAVKALDQSVGQTDAHDARVLRFFARHGFPFVDTKHYRM